MGGTSFTYQNSHFPLIEVLGDGIMRVQLVRDWGRGQNMPNVTRIDVNVAHMGDLIFHSVTGEVTLRKSPIPR